MELVLRDRQHAALEKLREVFRHGHKSVILYGPTGFGKTELAVHLMDATRTKANRSAMVMDRIVLCNQTSLRLEKYGIDHGVLQSGHWRYRPDELIQVCSAQTLEARGSFPGLALLLVDEAHDQRRSIKEFIERHPNVRVIGLSASPFTKGLGNTYSTVVNAVTTKELVDEGWLAPLRVFVAKEIDMQGAKTVAGEWSDGEATKRGIQITGDVVAEWVKMTHEVFGGPRKTIVFSAGVAHGEDLQRGFQEAGYNFLSISYKDDDQFKADVIEDFSRPDTEIMGVIATDILTKGFDVPDVMIGISARPFKKSLSSHVQQMGRVMRPYPEKSFALWLDHSGNYLRFREQWEEIYANGISELCDGKEKAQKEPSKEEKEAAKCPVCHALWPPQSDVCLHCGHTRQRRNDVVTVAGEMQELGAGVKEAYDMKIKTDWYAQLMGYAQTKGYAEGWSYFKYKEKFGVFPSMKKPAPVFPGEAVLNFIKSRQIAYAKRRV